jgi:hypothetical protein
MINSTPTTFPPLEKGGQGGFSLVPTVLRGNPYGHCTFVTICTPTMERGSEKIERISEPIVTFEK